jgi:hypothetical protein
MPDAYTIHNDPCEVGICRRESEDTFAQSEIRELIAAWREEDGLSDEEIIAVLEAAIGELRAGRHGRQS